MAIETLEDWNERLGFCGCCEMPACPVPEIECQSMQGSATFSGWTPCAEPAGDPDDDVPTLYGSKSTFVDQIDNGVGQRLLREDLGGGISTEYFRHDTYTDNVWVIAESVFYSHDDNVPTCSLSGDAGSVATPSPASVSFDQVGDATWECSETEAKLVTNYESQSGVTLSPQRCPGPFTATDQEYWDFTRAVEDGTRVSTPKTKDGLRTQALADIPGSWPGTPEGTACAAAYETTWPTIGEITWPACQFAPTAASAETTLTKSRFRWAIPTSWAGSYFLVTWDILDEPEGWDATMNDPEATPPDPLPEGVTLEEWWADHQVPDPDAPDRTFALEDQTWEWAGPGNPSDASTWRSPWFEIAPPEVPGERRVVNVRFICYRSIYGEKPQVSGEAVTLPDFE